MARIPYVTPDTLPEEAKADFDKLAPLNIFRMMAHSGKLLGRYIRLGNYLLTKSKLDPVLREIAILRVGYLSNAGYETYQHERIGRDVGMSDELIEAVKQGPEAKDLDPLQRQVVAFTDDLVHNVRASDKTFKPLQDILSVAELQELVMTVGYYMMTCRFLETFDVDIEDSPIEVGVS